MMTHEVNFLVAAGGDFYGMNKPDIPFGMELPADTIIN